jgi:hypothetical protein
MAMNKETLTLVENSIIEISKEFRRNRALYLSESDMKCRLFKLIDRGRTFISNGIRTFYVHTEVSLYGDGGKNKIDIYMARFLKFKLDEKRWHFEDTEEDIGIELKFNYGNFSAKSLLNELKKDRKRLLEYGIVHKYIVCFDHNGELNETVLEQFKDVKFIYVDGSNKRIYGNFGKH